MVNVPVASLQLFYQPAFGVSPVPQELRRTDIESQRAKQHAVTSKISEYADELPQVFSQECVRLPFRHGACRVAFALLSTVPPTHIGIAALVMPAFKVAGTQKRPFHKRQTVDSRLPVRSLLAVALCRHGANRPKRAEDSHEHTHHLGIGLKLPAYVTVWLSPSAFRLLKSNSNSKEFPKLSSTTTMKLCASSPAAV